MGVPKGMWLFPNWKLEVEREEGAPEDEYGPDCGMSSDASLVLSVLRDQRCVDE